MTNIGGCLLLGENSCKVVTLLSRSYTGLPALLSSTKKMRVKGKRNHKLHDLYLMVLVISSTHQHFLFVSLVIAFNILLLCASSLGITSFLNTNDQSRLKDILLSGLNSEDAAPLDYAIRGLALLDSDIPNKDGLCRKLSAKLESQNTETLFHIGKVSSVLSCSAQLSTTQKEKLEAAITASSGVSELFFATGALSSFGVSLDAPKVLKALNAALKKDDSISNLGQAFQIASILDGDVSSIFGRIEDAVVQADQVNMPIEISKMLKFNNTFFETFLGGWEDVAV
jgi:oligosaccharyltransferase complex subunit delta (ribophorin II)